jgi:hypothetical protein
MTRRVLGLLSAVVSLVAALVVLTGGTAAASPSGVQVGLHPAGPFSDALPQSLFRGTGKLVPGDVVTRTFYVRNGSDVDTRASVRVLLDEDAALARALDVRVGLGGGPVQRGTGNRGVTDRVVLAPGDVRAIDVALSFDRNVTGLQDMSERAALDLLVTLTQTRSSSGVDPSDPSDPSNPSDPSGPAADPAGSEQGCQAQVSVPLADAGDAPRPAAPSDDRPACVPTSVASGAPGSVAIPLGTPTEDPMAAARFAVLAVLAGATLFVVAGRRRRDDDRTTVAPRG